MISLRRLLSRMNEAAWGLILFLVLETVCGAALYTNFSKTRQRYCTKELEQLRVAYQAIFNTYEQSTLMLFSEITATPGFRDLISAANATATDTADNSVMQDGLRTQLLTMLLPRYRQGWQHHVDALEFHLPGGVNFVRVQAPSRYGDRLLESRPSVRIADTQRLVIKGFEHTPGHAGFRYLFPVSISDTYAGILEIGIAIDGIRDEMEELFMREFLFLLKVPETGNPVNSGHTDQRSRLSAAYLRDETNIFIHEGESTIMSIEKAVQPVVADRLRQESAFVTTARAEGRHFLVTFLPVADSGRHHAAYIVSYKEDRAVQDYLEERLVMMGGLTIGNVVLLGTVSLLRRSRRRAARDERRFKLITESMHEGVCVLDRENLVTFVNRAGVQMLQYSRDELHRLHLSDLAHCRNAPEAEHADNEAPVYQALAQGRRYTSENYALRTKDGRTMPVELTSAPLFERRRQVGSVVVFRDITARKEAEAKLQQMNRELQEASRHKSEFLSRMSHELRTPLNAMIGYTTLSIETLTEADNPVIMENLRKAERAARKLLELINDVLDFSKIEAGHMEVFVEAVDLNDVLEDALLTVEGLLLDSAVTLQTDIAPDLPTLHTDYTKLTQILNNLLGNAVKFTDSGMVSLRTFPGPEPEIVQFEVEDTGCGIPAEKLDTIFESFKQVDGSTSRHYGGTGLGLAITKRFCDMLGIAISVESVEGQGSLFRLRVPVRSTAPAVEAEHIESPNRDDTAMHDTWALALERPEDEDDDGEQLPSRSAQTAFVPQYPCLVEA